METNNQTNQKNKTNYVELVEKIANPATGKKLMIGTGSIGFAACFSGLVYGNAAFALGFVIMLCSATGYHLIAKTNQ